MLCEVDEVESHSDNALKMMWELNPGRESSDRKRKSVCMHVALHHKATASHKAGPSTRRCQPQSFVKLPELLVLQLAKDAVPR